LAGVTAADEGGLTVAHAVRVLRRAEVAELRTATREAWQIFQRVTPLLSALPGETLLDIGVPREGLACTRMTYPGVAPTVFGRFDFIATSAGLKLIEFNAETPYLLRESHELAGMMCARFGLADPNAGAEECLARGLAAALGHEPRVVVTAYDAAPEDRLTANYLVDLLRRCVPRVDYAPLRDLSVDGEALYDDRGPIGTLCRLYPLELFARDEGAPQLFSLISKGILRVINPPTALLLQNKLVQVIIWGLHEQRAFFSTEEHAVIDRLFLPSYADLPGGRGSYVRKPAYGREGNSVSIVRDGAEIHAAAVNEYGEQPMLYQQWVEPPRIEFDDSHLGRVEGYGVMTCFVVNGEPTAVGMRVGDLITGVNAHFLPLAYAAEE
jgi:glutathionylspermidine synthase